MVRRALLAICSALLLIGMGGCGQTYELQSISVSPTSFSLGAIGATEPLVVTAVYTNTKSEVVTAKTQFGADSPAGDATNAPPSALKVNLSGVVEVVGAACTWTATQGADGTTYTYSSQPYVVTATFEGHQTQAFVNVNSEQGCYDPTFNPELTHGSGR
jgi:hypothetical protein